MATPHLQIRPGNPDFLDLDWARPVDEWEGERLVAMPVGVHRHPVTFVAYPEGVYAIKELPLRLARHEFEMLRLLEETTNRSARGAGLVERSWLDPHTEGAGAVITRYIQYAFPYRELVTGPGFGARRSPMLDAFAGLLVELHLVGCFWGDASLSNVLYRFDGGGIEAVMVDAETTRLHAELTRGQRQEDLEIMRENVAGDMADIAAEQGFDLDAADLGLGDDIIERYRSLWVELTAELVIGPDDRYLIRKRINRLNELGFAVDDLDLQPAGAGELVKMTVKVGGRTFHSQRLRELTGIVASENQARQILSDLRYHEPRFGGSATAKEVAAIKWRSSIFEPLIIRIKEHRPDGDPLQGYSDFLHHRFIMATHQERDVPNEEAFDDWTAAGMPGTLEVDHRRRVDD